MLGELARTVASARPASPLPGSPVLDRIPAADCSFAPFGDVLEGEQHLEGLVADRLALARRGPARRPATAGTGLRRRRRGGGGMTARFGSRALRFWPPRSCAAAAPPCARLRRIGRLGCATRGRRGGRGLALAADERAAANVRALRGSSADLAEQVELMEQSAESYEDWQTCLRVRARQRARRPRSAVRLPLRRARRDRRRATWTGSRSTGGAAGQGGLPVHPLPRRRLPERQPPARRDRRACVRCGSSDQRALAPALPASGDR